MAKRTKYQDIFVAKKMYCAGKVAAKNVRDVADVYVKDAVEKGKPRAEAVAAANKILERGCIVEANGVKPGVAGTKAKAKKGVAPLKATAKAKAKPKAAAKPKATAKAKIKTKR